MIPTTNKVEMHITYACDLHCGGCNRGSFMQKPHTANMTVDDVHEFFSQAHAVDWRPRACIVIGGEPTLHPEFLSLLAAIRSHTDQLIQVWSNQYRDEARKLVRSAVQLHGVSPCQETRKPNGSVKTDAGRKALDWTSDIYISPTDHEMSDRIPCFSHASIICGISVDHEGYTTCAMGGAVDGMLGLGVRTKTLAELFDPEKAEAMTRALCAHCGWRMGQSIVHTDECGCELLHGVQMSPTWQAALKGKA